MQKYFSVGEAARAVNATKETLRHYDRIGLVTPSKKDEWTNYRYYSQQDIVRLNTVRALQQMDLPLQEIKRVLEYDDLEKVIDFLTKAEKKADEKIAALQYSKSKIRLAKASYEKKLHKQQSAQEIYYFPQRVILLSDTLETPTLDNLWNYLSHFYDKIDSSQREQFSFEDLAGVYTEHGRSRLFAVCVRYQQTSGLKVLPAGKYLCADCTEEDKDRRIAELMQLAKDRRHTDPEFSILLIRITGILQWNYQAQIYFGP